MYHFTLNSFFDGPVRLFQKENNFRHHRTKHTETIQHQFKGLQYTTNIFTYTIPPIEIFMSSITDFNCKIFIATVSIYSKQVTEEFKVDQTYESHT